MAYTFTPLRDTYHVPRVRITWTSDFWLRNINYPAKETTIVESGSQNLEP